MLSKNKKAHDSKTSSKGGREYTSPLCQTVEVENLAENIDFRVIDIEYLVGLIQEGVFLFHRQRTFVYLQLRATFVNSILRSSHHELIPFKWLSEVLRKSETFIIFRDSENEQQILPVEKCTEAFDYLSKIEPTPYKVSMTHLVRGKSSKKLNIKDKRDQRTDVENSVRTRKRLSSKVIPARRKPTDSEIYYPCEEIPALPNYPIQVSEDQREGASENVFSDTARDPVFNFVYESDSLRSMTRLFPFPSQHEVTIGQIVVDEVLHGQERYDNFQTPYRTETPVLRGSSLAPAASSPPARHPEYAIYDHRLRSYIRFWPHTKPSPLQLTDAGFFFTNQVDLVRCFQCGIGLKDFSPADDPLLEHVRYSGQCPYLSQHFGEERVAGLKVQLQETDPEYNRQAQLNDLRNHHNAVATARYRHPEYQTIEARLATFTGWPPGAGQTPRQLAEAGLYYTGIEDHVRCFACDGGLRRWDTEDDPWTEHCRWFPACPYCIEQKGEEFIAIVQAATDEDLGATGGETLVNTMNRLTIRSTEVQAVYDECRDLYRDMGFQEEDVKQAILELLNRGNPRPSIDEVVDLIGVIHERLEAEAQRALQENQSNSPYEQNSRLKSMVYCSECHRNNVNVLFLPCTHLKFCMECTESLDRCPLCNRVITQKIKTFMG